MGYWSESEIYNISKSRLPWEWDNQDIESMKSRELLDLIERYREMNLPLDLSVSFLIEIMIFDKTLDIPKDKDLRTLASHFSQSSNFISFYHLNGLPKIGAKIDELLLEKGKEIVKDIENNMQKLKK